MVVAASKMETSSVENVVVVVVKPAPPPPALCELGLGLGAGAVFALAVDGVELLGDTAADAVEEVDAEAELGEVTRVLG